MNENNINYLKLINLLILNMINSKNNLEFISNNFSSIFKIDNLEQLYDTIQEGKQNLPIEIQGINSYAFFINFNENNFFVKEYKKYINIDDHHLLFIQLSNNNITPKYYGYLKTNTQIFFIMEKYDYDLYIYLTTQSPINKKILDELINKIKILLIKLIETNGIYCYDIKIENIVIKDLKDVKLIDIDYCYCNIKKDISKLCIDIEKLNDNFIKLIVYILQLQISRIFPLYIISTKSYEINNILIFLYNYGLEKSVKYIIEVILYHNKILDENKYKLKKHDFSKYIIEVILYHNKILDENKYKLENHDLNLQRCK